MSFLFGAIAAGAVVKSSREQRKASKAQIRAIEAEQAQADIQATRARFDAVRRARVERERLANVSAVSGVESSSIEGAIGSVTSSLAGELGDSRELQRLGKFITRKNIASSNAQSKAALFGTIGNVAGSIFEKSNDFTKFTKFLSGG